MHIYVEVYVQKQNDYPWKQAHEIFHHCANFKADAVPLQLCIEVPTKELSGNTSQLLYFILLLSALILLAFRWTTERLIRKALSPFEHLLKVMTEVAEGKASQLIPSSPYSEIRRIEESSANILERLEVFRAASERAAAQAAVGRIASQVSHDIRSPLSAMEMISSQLNELPEEKRIIIRNSINRIRDIANFLLVKNPPFTLGPNDSTSSSANLLNKNTSVEPLETALLLPILEIVVTEKRIEHRDKLHINVNFQQTKDCYGLFSKVNIQELKCVLSNVINNAIEALHDESGKIDIGLCENQDGFIEITIQDNGKGIHSGVLSKLGILGNTFDKIGGSGLGLAHAKEKITSFGGAVLIESRVNIGTKITLKLPRDESPTWFVPRLLIEGRSRIVIFDDDQSIHQIWKGRLESAGLVAKEIELIHFSNPNELRKFYGQNFTDLDSILFLMDFEISNCTETGLDLIEELGIHSQSILVTSRYEEVNIRTRCERNNIKLIPKSMSGFVPIKIA